MKRALLALLGAGALCLFLATPALAHPLGNFTINHFTRLEITGADVRVLYVLDFAEIPAFQEKQRSGADPAYLDHLLAQLTRGLKLEIDGQPAPLRAVDRSLRFLPGQGGLEIMRLEILYDAPAPSLTAHAAYYRDDNYAGRLGWKEVVVQASQGATVLETTAPSESISGELRRYPEDLLLSPPNVTEARFRFTPGVTGEHRPPILGTAGVGFRVIQDRLAALMAQKERSLPVLAVSILVALALGALHALSPGHGKAVMASYLVGTRGTRRQALGLGLTITVTHTIGVFALGLVTLYAAGSITPERVYPWLALVSGLLILAIGTTMVVARTRAALHSHPHDHPHHHHDHAHAPGRVSLGRGSLLALGVSGGLIPCPSALVVLLASVSLNRLVFGLLLIVAFSAGLALTLTAFGIALAGGIPLLRRLPRIGGLASTGRALRLLPVASAMVVALIGLGLTAQALPGVH